MMEDVNILRLSRGDGTKNRPTKSIDPCL